MGHKHRIRHGNGDDILKAKPDDFLRRAFRAQKDIATLNRRRIARGNNPVLIRPLLFPDRIPTAKVRPARRERHGDKIVGPLHHGIVNGNVFAFAPGQRIKPPETKIGLAVFNRPRDRIKQARRMPLEGGDHVFCPEQENPRIPEVIAGLKHAARRVGIRLFDKAAQGDRIILRNCAQLKIAIARGRAIGGDAEGDNLALFDHRHALGDRRVKGGCVGNDVIGRRNQQDSFGVGLAGENAGGKHRRGGIAALGFDQDGTGVNADGLKLFADDEPEIRCGQRHMRRKPQARRCRQPLCALLKQRFGANQVRELLGIGFSRQRPKPRAAAACKKNRNNFNHHTILFSWEGSVNQA